MTDNHSAQAKADEAKQEAKEKVEGAAENVKQKAGEAAQEAKDRAGEVRDRVKAQAQEARGRVEAEAEKGFEQGKGQVISQVSSVAQAFRKTSEQLREEDQADLAGW